MTYPGYQRRRRRNVGFTYQAVVVNGTEDAPPPEAPQPAADPCGPGMEECGTSQPDAGPICCPTETPGGNGPPSGGGPDSFFDVSYDPRKPVPFAARAPAPRPPGAPVTIDVRTRGEFRTGHLPGALNIPIDELEQRFEEVAEATLGDWNAPLRVYCAKGIRSGRAAEYLRGVGFKNVRDLGGLESSLRTVRRPQVILVGDAG